MNIAVIGIGGIGGYIGAYLAKHYTKTNEHTITFIQRGVHGETIAKQGLTFIAKQTFISHPHAIYSTPLENDIFDLVFFCVKSKDLESTARGFSNHMHANTVCISLLNGVNNAKRLETVLPHHRILDGCIYVSAAITAPGVVTQKGGSGLVYFGPSNKEIRDIDTQILSILQQASIKSELSTDITTEVWRKYLFICPFATMTSLYNLPIGVLIRKPELFNQTQSLMQEIVNLATIHKAHLTTNDIDSAIELAFKIPEQTPTSMQLDIYAGKQPELEVFTQYVVSESKTFGIDCPTHSMLLPLLEDVVKKQVHHG